MEDIVFGCSRLNDILRHYELYSGHIDLFTLIPQRLTNLNATFCIGKQKWVIKRYDKNDSIAQLKLSHKVQLHLQDEGFPCARLEVTKEGESLLFLNGEYYSIHQWLDGVHMDYVGRQVAASNPVIEQVAKAIAWLHKEGREQSFQETIESNVRPFTASLNTVSMINYRSRFGLSRINKLRLKIVKTDFDKWVLNKLPGLCALAVQLADIDTDTYPALMEQTVIHNDINWENMLFRDDKLVAIIDFDNMLVGSRQRELGEIATVLTMGESELLSVFVSSYCQESSLSADEHVLRIGMLHKCVKSMLWSMYSYMNGKVVDIDMLSQWCFFLDRALVNLLAEDDRFSSDRI